MASFALIGWEINTQPDNNIITRPHLATDELFSTKEEAEYFIKNEALQYDHYTIEKQDWELNGLLSIYKSRGTPLSFISTDASGENRFLYIFSHKSYIRLDFHFGFTIVGEILSEDLYFYADIAKAAPFIINLVEQMFDKDYTSRERIF